MNINSSSHCCCLNLWLFYWIQVRSLPCLVSQSVTPSCSWDLIDVTLACEDHATSPCVAIRLPCGCFAVVMLLLHFCYAVVMLLLCYCPLQNQTKLELAHEPFQFYQWIVNIFIWICQYFYIDLSNLYHGFVKIVICVSFALYKTKQSWSLT